MVEVVVVLLLVVGSEHKFCSYLYGSESEIYLTKNDLAHYQQQPKCSKWQERKRERHKNTDRVRGSKRESLGDKDGQK